MKELRFYYNEDVKNLTPIKLTEHGDYTGNTVERSNYLTIKKELMQYKGVYDVYGSYSYSAIYYNELELTVRGKQKIDSILEALDNYPVYNEDHFNELEYSIKSEYIQNELELHTITEDQFWNLYNNIVIGTGCNAYIPRKIIVYLLQ